MMGVKEGKFPDDKNFKVNRIFRMSKNALL